MNQRFAAQLLSGRPARSVLDVVDRLLAVQGQDPRGVRLAVRARSVGLTAADVDRALTVDRSVIITWLNRGTLHLVRTDDYWWLRELTTPPLFSGNARRLAQEGVSPQAAERGVAAIEQALRSEGPLTRAQLRDRVAAADVRVQGQALVHVLVLASLRGLTVRGPIVDGDHAYALAVSGSIRRRARSTATLPWLSSPGATSLDTAPPTTMTSPSGRASRCATLAGDSPPSVTAFAGAMTGCSS